MDKTPGLKHPIKTFHNYQHMRREVSQTPRPAGVILPSSLNLYPLPFTCDLQSQPLAGQFTEKPSCQL